MRKIISEIDSVWFGFSENFINNLGFNIEGNEKQITQLKEQANDLLERINKLESSNEKYREAIKKQKELMNSYSENAV